MARWATRCVGIALLAAGVCTAADYPQRPIRLIVPSPAGGGMDNLARAIGSGLSERWGQQIVVDARPGAAGIIGTELAAKAAPDGHTLLLAWIAPLAINPALYRKLPYDVMRDFEPVMQVATTPNVLIVGQAFPARSVAEFVAAAKASPGKLSYASSGVGGSSHLVGALFSSSTGIDMVHVPFKGTPPALVDIMAGRVQAMFAAEAPALPHIRSGKLRALAVSTAKRSPNLPDVPPIADTVAGFDAHTWYGLMAPAGTPKAIVAKLNAEVAAVLRRPAVEKSLNNQGFAIVASTQAEYVTFLRREIEVWGKVVERAGLPRR